MRRDLLLTWWSVCGTSLLPTLLTVIRTCQIKKTGENLSAVFTISGTEMTVKEIKKESNTYKCNFYVDGTYVSLIFKQEDKNQLVGKANAEGMVIPITFTKIIKAVQAR